MKRLVLPLLIILGVSLAGCGADKPESPRQVAENFWLAVTSGDIETARRLSVNGSPNPDDFSGDMAPTFNFAETATITGNTARVATTTEPGPDQNDIAIAFDTVLVKRDDAWKVDFSLTQSGITAAIFEAMGDELSRNLDEVGDELGKALGEVMKEVGDSVNDALKQTADELKRANQEVKEELARDRAEREARRDAQAQQNGEPEPDPDQ